MRRKEGSKKVILKDLSFFFPDTGPQMTIKSPKTRQ